jgi:hypothetical protein
MISLTEIVNNNGIIAKRYTSDGVLPAANVSSASARTVKLELNQVSKYLNSLDKKNDTAILLGVWDQSDKWEKFDIVTDSSPNKNPEQGVIARTTEFFRYANSDQVSLVLFDFDSGATVAEREQFLGDLDELLYDCIIDEKSTGKICKWSRPSSSATVQINGETGKGLHVFIPVKNAKPELLELIHRWAWLNDYGSSRHKVSRAAIVLPVSIIDPAVRGPERIIYTSAAVVEREDAKQIDRTCSYSPGGILDCELALNLLGELTADFKTKWNSHKQKVANSREVLDARKEFMSAKTAELVNKGHSVGDASTLAKALSDRVLLSSSSLTRTDGSLVRVLDILLSRDSWLDEAHFCDPIKLNVGRNVAQIKGDDNHLILHSFSHGGIIYKIEFAFDDLLKWIEKADEREVMQKFRNYVGQGTFSSAELESLASAAAAKLGLAKAALRADAKAGQKNKAEAPEITEDSEFQIDPDATHYQITEAYLAGVDARSYGDGLFLWKQGATIWEKQSLHRVVNDLGTRFGHVSLCRTASHYRQVAGLIMQNPYISVEDWPRKYGIPCVDGFYEVIEGQGTQVVPYKKDFGCRWKLKIKPDFSMKTPLFDKVIANVENPILFQQLFGLLVSGYLRKMQKVAVFFGEGGSGKGTTNDILTALLPTGKRTGISLQDMNNPERLMPLVDSAVNIVPEIRKTTRPLDLTGLKMLTGGDLIAGRQLYVGMVHFMPACCHVLNMNDWPMLSSTGSEIERRMGETIVRFNKTHQDAIVGLAEQVIRHELPGILAWAIEGIRLYFSEGLDSTRSLELFTDWTKSFSPISAFVDEYCVLVRNREGAELRSDLWLAFSRFCEESKFGVVPGKYEFYGELVNKYKCIEGRVGKITTGRTRTGTTLKGILLNAEGKNLLRGVPK